MEKEEELKRKARLEKKKGSDELNQLFKPVEQRVGKGEWLFIHDTQQSGNDGREQA